jgi:endoglucanase
MTTRRTRSRSFAVRTTAFGVALPGFALGIFLPLSAAWSDNDGGFYVDPNSNAAKQAAAWAKDNPSDAQAMRTLAAQPTGTWFGSWNSNIQTDVHNLVTAAAAQNQTPVMVAYNIPNRDCGGASSGGAKTPADYQSWIGQFAQGLGQSKALIILEPDALALISCLSDGELQTRLGLLAGAVTALKQDRNAKVYIDAGHSNWVDPAKMAGELKSAGIDRADGFSTNISNFRLTADEVAYGQKVSAQAGNKHFVIDTSRNGNGPNGDQWCNPRGRAIGAKPTTQTGNALVDAFLWIKVPGESDGNSGECNGGPAAGTWWPHYALKLVRNAK